MRQIARALFAVSMVTVGAGACSGATPTPAKQRTQPIAESRVILDEVFSWWSEEGTDRVLDRIERAGFNVFMPCVWNGQGVTWVSDLEEPAPRMAAALNAGRDPLGDLIDKAHARGIEVHPWFKISHRAREFRSEFYDEGTPRRAFDVHKPEFRRYIVDLMLEVVARYDIDGVNLDYVRTKGYCTSDYCVRQYREKTGRDLLADQDGLRLHTEAWNSIVAWNAEAVEAIIEPVTRGIRELRPDILISADSHPGRVRLKRQGTDSVVWVNRGWLDVVYAMEYADQLGYPDLRRAYARLHEPDRLVIMRGNYVPPRKKGDRIVARDAGFVADTMSMMQLLHHGGNGVALYQYKTLTDAQIEALANGPFKVPAYPHWPAVRD